MPQAIYVHAGDAIDHTPTTAVAAGDVVVQGALVGVARVPIAANALGAIAVAGVFDFDKATGSNTAISAGALVYWNNTTKLATTTSSGNTLLGKAVRDATTTDAVVRVRLSQ